VAACAACAAEAALDMALTHAAGAGARTSAAAAVRREAIWNQIEQAMGTEAGPRAAGKSVSLRLRFHLGLAAVLLVVGLVSGMHWWSARRGPGLDHRPSTQLALGEAEPVDDPMGPTTDAWLAVLEGKK